MTVYPNQIDDDRSIIRIDDNLSELGTSAINQIRDAIFAIEKTLGINPQGSKGSLNDRISVLIGPDGNPVAATFETLGLVTLPIHDNQVASNAGIQESKLALAYSTSDLNTEISALSSQTGIISDLILSEHADLLIHITGGQTLSDNITLARHVASQIDINAVPLDSRDSYTWTGLLNRYGVVRPATQVAEALLEINNELVQHENATSSAHTAAAITVNSSSWVSFPTDLLNVQETLNYIDNQNSLSSGQDRANLNSNGIARGARVQDLAVDGYNVNVVPVTHALAYLAEPSGQSPNDSILNGDDVIRFLPDNTSFAFDSKFANVKVGDLVTINYGNGYEAVFPIKSIRFLPGTEWAVRINSSNLFSANGSDGYDGYARIDRSKFDNNTWGVLAAAGAVPNTFPNTNIPMDSIILGSPRGATAVGIGFDPNKLDINHYNLYLRMYPHGSPTNFIDLPAIDVTGNAGITPGKYSLDRVVEATNTQFRKAGYNYRFIAFNQKGEFGVMLADPYGGASFSIISGQVSTSTIIPGQYVKNVIGDATDGYDALGLGGTRAGFATPVAPSGYSTAIEAANYATLIIPPVTNRNYLVNGARRDTLAYPSTAQGDGYWIGTIANITTSYVDNTEIVDYVINLDLASEDLAPGKTIVVQPVDPTNNSTIGYGRFIIGNVSFQQCGVLPSTTTISVINGVHGTGSAISTSSPPIGTIVLIYFTNDSVGFNTSNLVGTSGNYHRYHEVFVTSTGESFSVERARMPKQSQSGVLLDTSSSWRIRRVSPQFKGYRTGTDFRYFIRFVMTNYNSTTGEYDGYLCEPGGFKVGQIVRGKKDFPIRYYDQTNINYIDLEFREDANNPGSTLLPDSISRYVDIELFETLREDDEYFAIAGVSHDVTSFKSITDLREFGTISEKNFSDSAMKFIQAGERYLHANGVVRGFGYTGTGITESILEFDGGTALVNGAFVAVDALEVKLPEVASPTSQIVQFYICVTETGQLIAVIKDTGVQYFSVNSPNYFIETLTFAEIVDKRKDLCIIAVATATIATTSGSSVYNLSSVTDARRHVINQDLGSYTFAYANQGDGYNANFITPDALMNWVNEYGIKEVKVWYVKQNNTSGLSLNFTNHVNLKGGTWEINTSLGINFQSGNWKISDATILYNPSDLSTATGEIFYADVDRGAFYIPSTVLVDIKDICIENCIFKSTSSARPPFVGFYSQQSVGGGQNNFYNIRLISNKISDTSATYALAYAFVNSSTSSGTAPTFNDILVTGTKIDASQGMIATGRATPDLSNSGKYLTINRVNVQNFAIRDNHFGYIGTITDEGDITIDNNTANTILSGVTATLHSTSLTYGLGVSLSTGYSTTSIVTNNKTGFIRIDANTGTSFKKVFVSGNQVTYTTTAFSIASIMTPTWAGSINRGIIVMANSYNPTNVICSNNAIDGAYLYGIYTKNVGAVISGNAIINIANSSWGINSTGYLPEQPSVITGNALEHATGALIGGFIYHDGACVTGNTFSEYNISFSGVDGYDGYGDMITNLATVVPMTAGVSNNVNQAVQMPISLSLATPLFHVSPTSGTVDTSTTNNRLLSYISPSVGQGPNIGLAETYFDYTEMGWVWAWVGASVSANDGQVGLSIPINIPAQTFIMNLRFEIDISTTWSVYQNGGSSTPDTTPEIVLEIDGVVVDSASLSSSGTHYLVYNADEYLWNTRPSTPYTPKNVVVRVRQNGTVYGGWAGPTGTLPTLNIGNAIVTYLY